MNIYHSDALRSPHQVVTVLIVGRTQIGRRDLLISCNESKKNTLFKISHAGFHVFLFVFSFVYSAKELIAHKYVFKENNCHG